ncbi:MAG: cobalamin biosynthesis protein CobD [Pseudodesulfovibrio sp.]|nr:cobalamin biosynthesis protein CobD [Pseudodesulfovibrio sp.]
MDSYVFAFVIPIAAVILDSLFGDPETLPHPVRYIGKGLDLYEAVVRRMNLDLCVAGWIAVVLFSAGIWMIIKFLMTIPYIGLIVAIYLGFAGLALGCLVRESRQVATLLDSGNLQEARRALSMLVSRDTSNLDPNGIRRTLAETVSENLNDGFVAPMFYLTIFGPCGLWAYKTVSTMDSMWGYKTEKYCDLGYAAAKIDDFLAYIPARITAWLMLAIGKRHRLEYALAKSNFQTDAKKMESPNAGWPMAAAAWLFSGQMGGTAEYFGKIKEKPLLGPANGIWNKTKIQSLITFCKKTGYVSAWVFILGFGWLQSVF